VTRTSVFYFLYDYWACGWYRCYVPGVALKELGYRVLLDEAIKPSDIDTHDVIVVQTPSGPKQLEAIRAANSAGKLSVIELDDDIWSLSPSNPSYPYWSRPEVKLNARSCVEEAQLVTTPTHALAEKLRTMNPNVKVLSNMLPTTGWDYPVAHLQREDRVVLGWAGSKSHGGDLRMIGDVVRQLLDRYPQLEFVVVGGPGELEIEAHERTRFLKATDIQHYPAMLEQFDVGIIPLAETAFNRSKSDLKFVEYSMLGIPSVASKLEPYLHTVKHGENGFLARSPKDWLKHLTRLIEDVELRRTIGARAQEYARTRTLDHAVEKWERAYGLTRP
jgi:glycosyltransferase involved in cell wall biosynthesis